jgi:hypothetical protein
MIALLGLSAISRLGHRDPLRAVMSLAVVKHHFELSSPSPFDRASSRIETSSFEGFLGADDVHRRLPYDPAREHAREPSIPTKPFDLASDAYRSTRRPRPPRSEDLRLTSRASVVTASRS